jgi:tyrosine-protein kinase Etk/Wzc
VTRELGLNILGALPVIKSGRSGKPDAEQTAHLLEALRSVRMNLTYAHGAAGPFITTVTSPGAGDGKSFLSANLARSFASSGRRTLLIDADTRRGVLHRTMGVDRKPGLLDYLSGDEARERVIRSIPEWGIDFMPCGTRKSGGPELLSSAAMAQLVGSLRTEYQAIIIDSPPLGAGVDPLLLASLTGSMVMVLRTGVTDREFAESRLSDLHRLPIRVLGAVLNDVKAEGIYRYYSYLPGYRAEDEETEDDPLSGPSRVLGPGTSTKKK